MSWTWQTWILAALIVLWGTIQYALAIYTLRDLARRPRVRGDNKLIWALVILTLPLVGGLIYATMGPTSFMPRDRRSGAVAEPASGVPAGSSDQPPAKPATDIR